MGKKRSGKRRQEKPTGAPIRVIRGGNVESIELLYSEHPNVAIFPIFRRPGILESGPAAGPELRVDGDPVAIGFGVNPLDVAKQFGASAVQIVQDMPVEAFAKTIGKIAYSETMRVFGPEAFLHVAVLPALRYGEDDIGRWVGTVNRQGVKSSNPFVWHILEPIMLVRGADDPIEVRCNVMLFANSDAPIYEVVVGVLHPGTPVPASMRPTPPPK